MKKRLAIVTGGTRGIGASISELLNKEGYFVAANYACDDKSAEEFSNKTGVKVFKWNVSDLVACEENVKRIEDAFSTNVEILVNNAGITRDGMLHKTDHSKWHEVINTNLTSCFNMSYATIQKMRDNGFGRIVNISSINALSGQVGQTNYSAAKAGILGLTKALAMEGASKGITVNAIAPGYVETEMTGAIKAEVMMEIIKNIPVGRLGTPYEIARSVLFLVSDDAGFITGETLSINGGHRMN